MVGAHDIGESRQRRAIIVEFPLPLRALETILPSAIPLEAFFPGGLYVPRVAEGCEEGGKTSFLSTTPRNPRCTSHQS